MKITKDSPHSFNLQSHAPFFFGSTTTSTIGEGETLVNLRRFFAALGVLGDNPLVRAMMKDATMTIKSTVSFRRYEVKNR